jgi:anti-anti-sigma factor
MKFALRGDTLSVSEIGELVAATASSFQSELAAALSGEVRNIDLDLSQTAFVDCGGLGALVAVRNSASNGHGAPTMRLLNAPVSLQQMVSLMKMESVFPIFVSPPREYSNLAIQPAAVGALASPHSCASLQ